MSRTIRAKPQALLQVYKKQNQEIKELIQSNEVAELSQILNKTLKFSEDKISDFVEKNKKRAHQIEEKVDENGFIIEQYNHKMEHRWFYMEKNGRHIFLHPLCHDYLLENYKEEKLLPLQFATTIILKQEIDSQEDLKKKYPKCHYLPISTDIEFVIVDLKELLNQQNYEQFQKTISILQQEKLKKQQRQKVQAQKIKEKYEKQKKLRKQMKQLAQKPFLIQINVPDVIPTDDLMSQESFPSLNSNNQKHIVKSQKENQLDDELQLCEALQTVKSQQVGSHILAINHKVQKKM